jgi:integrase
MPRKVKQLNATQVKNLKLSAKILSFNDGYGLVLRVKTTGVKTWIFNYYSPITEKRSNLTLGNYPALSLVVARERASVLRQQVSDGIDPKRQQDKERRLEQTNSLNTFKSVADEYFAIKRLSLKDNTILKWERSLANDVFPLIGNIPAHEITFYDGKKVRDKIIARGSYDIARKTCNYMNQIMVYSSIKPNPLADLTAGVTWPTGDNQKAITPQELPELFKAFETSNMNVQTKQLILFQLHTLVRPKEAATIEWSDIDFENNVWIIPSEKRKGKKGKELLHIVPLSYQVLEILETMKIFSANRKFVFTGRHNQDIHVNPSSANSAIKRTALVGRLVAHGMRTIGKTAIQEIGGFEHIVAEAALSHRPSTQTEKAYTRTDFLERRKPMMQWWSDYIDSAKTGKSHEQSFNNVIAFNG